MPTGVYEHYSHQGFQKGHKIGMTGKYHSKETKEKMSLVINSGQFKKGHNKGIIFPAHMEMLHKLPRTLIWKKRISEASKGENHWNWRGGISKNKEYQRKWRKEYYYRKPIIKLNSQKRQALKKGGGDLTIQTIQCVYEDNIKKYGTLTCYLCEFPIEFKQDSLEHKTPLSRGGTNERKNLAIAHRSCNCKKNNKTEEEYRKLKVRCESYFWGFCKDRKGNKCIGKKCLRFKIRA